MKLGFSGPIFEKFLNIKFHKNVYSGSRDIPRGQTDTLELMIAFQNFANTPMKALGQSRHYRLHKEQLVKRPVLYASILNLERTFINRTHKHKVFGYSFHHKKERAFIYFPLYVFECKLKTITSA